MTAIDNKAITVRDSRLKRYSKNSGIVKMPQRNSRGRNTNATTTKAMANSHSYDAIAKPAASRRPVRTCRRIVRWRCSRRSGRSRPATMTARGRQGNSSLASSPPAVVWRRPMRMPMAMTPTTATTNKIRSRRLMGGDDLEPSPPQAKPRRWPMARRVRACGSAPATGRRPCRRWRSGC